MKKPQLFLFHFAGGNRYSFRFLEPWLKDFEPIPLELPGRGKRMGEMLLRDLNSAANDLFRQVTGKLSDHNFLFYGHSMGAYLALRVARMCEEAGKLPSNVVVSGNAGPGIRKGKDRFLLSREDFVSELKRLGGIPEEFLNDSELFELFEPVLRSDFEIADRNKMDNEAAITAPLFAMMGSEEEDTESISNWAKYTHGSFDYEIMPGDHFFIHQHPDRIAEIIKKQYNLFLSLKTMHI